MIKTRKNRTNNGDTQNINGVQNWNNRQIIAIQMKKHRAGGGSTATASDKARLGQWYVRQPMCMVWPFRTFAS